ncbi:MAG: thioredoxin, partial [Actinobacteria bacterium]
MRSRAGEPVPTSVRPSLREPISRNKSRRDRVVDGESNKSRKVFFMATVALTKETFDETVQNNDTVIVDFWAEWCGPCRSFAPTFEAASEKHDDIVFAKVDTEDQQELAMAFGIRSIPTLMVFKEQVILYSQPGALPAEMFEDL